MKSHEIRRHAAWARVELGMSPAEFYDLSPADFMLLVEAWSQRERRLDIRVAQLRLTCAAAMGATGPGGDALTLEDFLPPEPGADSDDNLLEQFNQGLPPQWRDQSAIST